MKPTILLVDDERIILRAYTKYLTRAGYDVQAAASLAEAREVFLNHRIDAVLLDMKLPDGHGLDYVAEIRQTYPDLPVVAITSEREISIAVEAMRRGADNFLTKPVSLEDLDLFLRKCLEVRALRRSSTMQQRTEHRPTPFIGSSPAMKEAVKLMELAAESDAPVALYGETGTGKGLMARWIHDHSDRSSAPFVEVNCSSLRGELLASELFGHAKGAFTSAVSDQQGLIELADGGTLFLDEIGDMDIGVQAQFLKVIEEKRYRRVGEVKERRSEFRLICATNHDLEQASHEGRFRKDLFFRIQVFPIKLPPLRQRREELPGLAAHILQALGHEHPQLQNGVLQQLSGYEWPGNVRELRNVLERAVLLARCATLEPRHLVGLEPASEDEVPANGNGNGNGDGRWNLRFNERSHIERAMSHFDNDTDQAAKALGVSRATLYRKLKTLEIAI
jgi:DNA-binding NtrC family response regulator